MTEPICAPIYDVFFTDRTTPTRVAGYLWEGRDGSVRFTRDSSVGVCILVVGAHVLHHVELVEEEK